MTTYYVDPSNPTNGTGTFTSPRNIFPTSLVYGDIVLFKEGTTYEGGWTVPTPTGTGSDTNRLLIGSYNKDTGSQLIDKKRTAIIRATNTQSGIFLSSISYVTIQGLTLSGTRDFPEACVRTINSSYTIVDNCNLIGKTQFATTGGYGLRFSNDTGSGTSQSNWVVTNNTIFSTGANSAIYLIWGANSGEYVTNITVNNNIIYGNILPSLSGASFTGIALIARGTNLYLNRAGLCAKGVQIQSNQIYFPRGYGIQVQGVEAGGTQQNIVSKNKVFSVNPQREADAHCIWLGGCSTFLVERNFVDTSFALTGFTYGTGVGIFIDIRGFGGENDYCTDIVVRSNIVKNTGKFAVLNLEVGGAGIMVLQGQRIDIHGNVVENCSNGIVVIGWYGTGGKANNINIFNNTVKDSNIANFYICKQADLVTLKNNVSINGERGYYIENSGSYAITNYSELTNREYNASFPWYGGDEPTNTTPSFSSRTPDVSNTSINPNLNIYNKPNIASPLIANGLAVGQNRDCSFSTIQTPPTIGAYEYVRPRNALIQVRTFRN